MDAPAIASVLESTLYARDLAAAERFYAGVLGLAVVSRSGGLSIALRAGESIVLVFDPAASAAPGRPVPSHGSRGPGHLALRIADADLDRWRRRLADHGVAIEHEQEWGGRGRSIYLRDPAGNSIELITADIWPR